MHLRFMMYNILTGGVGPGPAGRTDRLLDVIRAESPDVLSIVEANGFLELESGKLGMAGVAGPAPSGFHVVLLTRPPLMAEIDCVQTDGFRHACLATRLHLGGGRRIPVLVTHLNPFLEEARLAEAERIVALLPEGEPALVLGDLNGLSPFDPITPESVERLLPQYRDATGAVERRALTRLGDAGLKDLALEHPDADRGPTYPTAGGWPSEGPPIRIDYALATRSTPVTVVGYRVVRTAWTDRASDHYPVVADLEIDLSAKT
jgi:endonuclease/exonuclease/phosphatase family metal-dependent hydrolase